MKRWLFVAAILFTSFSLLLLLGGVARADGFDLVPSILATVITKMGVLVDQVLGHWVTGSGSVSPQGDQLVGAIAQSVANTIHFLAQLVTMF